MKISVILTILDVDENLYDCINSIKRQLIDKFELIVCINNSFTDCQRNALKTYIENVKFIEQHKYSTINAIRNEAISLSRGDYIIFIDTNNILHEGCLKLIYKEVSFNRVDLLTFDHNEVHENRIFNKESLELTNKINCISRNRFLKSNIFSGEEFYKNILSKNLDLFNLSTYIFKSEFLKKNSILFDEKLNIDNTYFILNSILKSKRIKYSPNSYIDIKLNDNLEKLLLKDNIEYIIYNIDNMVKILKGISYNLLIPLFIKFIIKYIDKLMNIYFKNKLEKNTYIIKKYANELKKDLLMYMNLDDELEWDIMLYENSLYNKKCDLEYYQNKKKYMLIFKLTKMCNFLKENNIKEFIDYFDYLNQEYGFNKYISYDNIVDCIKTYKDYKTCSVDMIKHNLYQLIYDLEMEINPEIINYNYVENDFKFILNNLNK